MSETKEPSREKEKISHEELVVAYAALHKVYTYLAQCDNDIVAVNLYSVDRKGKTYKNSKNGIRLKRLATTGRGADYALPEEDTGNKKMHPSIAGRAPLIPSPIGYYISPEVPSDPDRRPISAFGLKNETESEPAQHEHFKKSYKCGLCLLAQCFASAAKEYSLVLISRCESSGLANEKMPVGYWLRHTADAAEGVPFTDAARSHFETAIKYLTWALPHWSEHSSPVKIQAWNRLPVVNARREGLPEAAKLVEQGKRGKVTYASVLFADIRGFTDLATKISQGAPPEHVLDFLSPMHPETSAKAGLPVGYFEAAHKVIAAFGGQLDKFMGDGVMGIFFDAKEAQPTEIDPQLYEALIRKGGITQPPPLHMKEEDIEDSKISEPQKHYIGAIQACLTNYNKSVNRLFSAINCSIALVSLFEIYWSNVWRDKIGSGLDETAKAKLKNVSLGIGICGGQLLAGHFGSRWHSQFTVLGDTVNRAQRMESQAGKKIVDARNLKFPLTGKTKNPDIIAHVPVPTIFAGILEIDAEIAGWFAQDLKNKMANYASERSFPLRKMHSLFLEDEENEITKKFDEYAVRISCHPFLGTTKKGAKKSGAEPAVGFYVDLISRQS